MSNNLLQHYGRDFVLRCMDNADSCVPTRITSKINVKTPASSVGLRSLQLTPQLCDRSRPLLG